MNDARAVLSELLSQIGAPDGDGMLRLQAAAMANRLALFHSDPSLTEVAESLLLDCGGSVSSDIRERLANESDVARATRRAIALSHRQKLRTTKERAIGLVTDASLLAREAKEHMAIGDTEKAQATLEIARARHPNDPTLTDTQKRIDSRLGTATRNGESGQDKPLPTG